MKISKITIISESIDVNDSSASKGRVALIKNLHSLGYRLKVYHYTKKEIKLESIECVNIPELKFTINYFLSRAQRLFTRYTKLNINPFIESLFGFSFTFFNDTNSIIKELKKDNFKPDLVLTLSKGASFRPHYALLGLSKLHDKWMAYVHDPYPFHYYPRPYNWVEPGFQKKERFFREVSEKAKFSAFPSQILKEWMGSYFPNFLNSGVVIPHQNLEIKIEDIEFPNYFDSTKFNLLHAGNLMKQRSPKGLIQGFQLFLKQNPTVDNARLYLIGNASYHKELLQKYVIEILELFVKTENEKFKNVYLMQQAACVNIILESKSEISPFLPGKFPHCVAANKPMLLLAPYYSETRRLLGADYPYMSEVDDINKIAENIESLYKKWSINSEELKLNRPDLEEYVSVEHLKNVLEDLNC